MPTNTRPNIILLMCDDLGYGDVGFNGNNVIRTPHLDALAGEGLRFTRYYAGGPVCSPTRGTCLTGRHYSRYGVTHANQGCLPTQEIALPGVCKQLGYRTGHFGKWHLGTLTRTQTDANRGRPGRDDEFSPPWLHGFDVCFSTESKVPTWDPMLRPDEHRPDGQPRWGTPGEPFGTAYWDESGQRVTENLAGCDSRIIVDRAEPFIRQCASHGDPFLAVIWFHAPHTPVVAGPEYRSMYADRCENEQHYYGCITAMDEQVGRVNNLVKSLGIEGETVMWFCSDNGPEGGEDLLQNGRSRGVTGGLRGRKRSLFDGGVGVPALLKWPGLAEAGDVCTMPCSTLDYFPTMADALGFSMPDERPVDGVNLLPMLRGEQTGRPEPIPYRFLESEASMFGSPTFALMDDRWKFLTNLSEDGSEDLLFDLIADRCETRNCLAEHPQRAADMRQQLRAFVDSCRHSHHGGDYSEPYEPINDFQEPTGTWR